MTLECEKLLTCVFTFLVCSLANGQTPIQIIGTDGGYQLIRQDTVIASQVALMDKSNGWVGRIVRADDTLVFRSVTVTLAIPPPEESATLPVMDPVVVCPKQRLPIVTNRKQIKIHPKCRTTIFFISRNSAATKCTHLCRPSTDQSRILTYQKGFIISKLTVNGR